MCRIFPVFRLLECFSVTDPMFTVSCRHLRDPFSNTTFNVICGTKEILLRLFCTRMRHGLHWYSLYATCPFDVFADCTAWPLFVVQSSNHDFCSLWWIKCVLQICVMNISIRAIGTILASHGNLSYCTCQYTLITGSKRRFPRLNFSWI